jgi:hypothetical protein
VVAIAIIAASVIGVATIMGGFGGTTDTNDYKIGTDRVPSVSYALGESRNVRSLEMDAKGGVETVTVVYDVSGDAQGDDMRAYFEYLTGSGGFEMRDGLGDDAFGGSSGASIQAWRNSKDSGYMVIVQADYDTNGYTITVMRGEGQTAETPGSTEPPESTQPPESAKPPESTQPPESEQPPESSQPPTTDVNLSSGVPATGAPLYVNSAVGFSIIPRENWYAEETESDGIPAVLVTTPKNDRIVIMSMQGYSMADFAADEEGFCQSTAQSMGGDGYTIGRSEKIKFAGYDCHLTGFMVTAQGTAVNYIFNYAFDGGSGKLYSIAYILPATATGAEHEELLDVFSTFKIQ